MARDVGNFEETKRVINEIEHRETGHDSPAPMSNLKTPFAGGKTHPTGKTFAKPSVGTFRKGME